MGTHDVTVVYHGREYEEINRETITVLVDAYGDISEPVYYHGAWLPDDYLQLDYSELEYVITAYCFDKEWKTLCSNHYDSVPYIKDYTLNLYMSWFSIRK